MGGKAYECDEYANDFIGVVDPWIKYSVATDNVFTLYLKPGSIMSLRHVWQHHQIDASPEAMEPLTKEKSQEWLENYAKGMDLTLEELVFLATRYQSHGEQYVRHQFEGGGGPGKEFWVHYCIYLGRQVHIPDGHFYHCGGCPEEESPSVAERMREVEQIKAQAEAAATGQREPEERYWENTDYMHAYWRKCREIRWSPPKREGAPW